MSNRYASGRAFEWRRRDYYKTPGYFVVRSAGSKTAVDLVCLHPNGRVLAVQCKKVRTQAEAERLIQDFKDAPPLGVATSRAGFAQVIDIYVKATRKVESVIL